MTIRRLQLGQRGEELASAHLQRLGYRIVSRNYRSRYGEIDLIAEESGVLVFIEVKTRQGDADEQPLEAITARKCKQISKLALLYVSERAAEEVAVRFDVVGVTLPVHGPPKIELIQNAFDLTW